jgi:hypothetical protein
MTAIGTIDGVERASITVIQPRVYMANDYSPIQVWDGVWSAPANAGIDSPSAAPGAASQTSGNVTLGSHLIAYYYRDSKSPGGSSEGYGYRSSISTVSTETVASTTKKLTFSVTAIGGGGDILRSADAKVDTIVLCATLAGGTVFYIVDEIDNSTDATVDYNVSDTLLTQYTPLTAVGGEDGHDAPPVCGAIAFARNFAFYGVQFARSTLVLAAANGSPYLTYSIAAAYKLSAEWAGRLITLAGDARSYVIDTIDPSFNPSYGRITLTENYAGTSRNNVASVVASAEPNRVWWSQQFYPESCSLLTRAIDTMDDTDDLLVCMTAFMGDPWFIGRKTAQRLVFSVSGNEIVDYELVTTSGSCGAWNRFCVVKPDADNLFCWGPNGVWVLSGGRPTLISGPIDSDWRALIDYDYVNLISGFYDPEERVVGWTFVETGESAPKRALVYSLDTGDWRIDRYYHRVDGACLLTNPSGRLQCLMSDASLDITFSRGGNTDGVPSGTGKYVVDSGSTTTVTQVTGSLPTGVAGTGLDKLMAYSPDLDEAVSVSDNTASSITHAAFSQSLTAGQYIYVGSIPVIAEMSWWVGDDQSREKVPEKIALYCIPSSIPTTMQVYQYRDFSTSPMTIANIAGRTYPKGVTVNAARTAFNVDMSVSDGYIEIPVGGTAAKVMKVKLVVDDPSGEFEILNVVWKPGDQAPGGDGE